MSPTTLSTSKTFLTALLSTLPSTPVAQLKPNVATNGSVLSTAVKPILLTLHALYPTILLPALDLLDRQLVTRLILHDESTQRSTTHERSEENQDRSGRMVYYVKSKAHRDGRSRQNRGGDMEIASYEVKTKAWNCTCPAFVYSAFSDGGSLPAYEYDDDCMAYREVNAQGDEEMLDVPERAMAIDGGNGWRWGGMIQTEEVLPLCKHLLACILVERWGDSPDLVEEREVSREEMAGWAAGWNG